MFWLARQVSEKAISLDLCPVPHLGYVVAGPIERPSSQRRRDPTQRALPHGQTGRAPLGPAGV